MNLLHREGFTLFASNGSPTAEIIQNLIQNLSGYKKINLWNFESDSEKISLRSRPHSIREPTSA